MKRIAFKLWMGMTLLVVVMLVLLWFFQIVFLDSFYLQHQISKVKNEGILLAEEWYQIKNENELENILEKFIYDFKSDVSVFDLNGNILFSTEHQGRHLRGRGPMMGAGRLQIGILKSVSEGNTVVVPSIHPRYRSELRLIGIPIIKDESVQGALLISMPVAPVEEVADTLKNQLILISILLLAVALAISFIMSKFFTKPILEIDKAAAEMASGNLKVRLKPKSKDELGRLTNTINNLAVQLSKVDQLRKDLIANVSHELRTPLSLIRGYAETIRDVSGYDREKRNRQLEIIIEESERLSKIVDDILNLSQMQAGYTKLNIKNFNLNNTVKNVVERYSILCEKLNIKMIIKSDEFVIVSADEAKIEQVLYNIINNALNHTSPGDTITIEVESFGKTIKVQISDTGSGIPEDELDYIWERYHKANKQKGIRQLGTGLGLTIVKSILQLHNSDFGVKSKAGEGTTFWFTLKKHRGS